MEYILSTEENRYIQELKTLTRIISSKNLIKLSLYKDRKFDIVGRIGPTLQPSMQKFQRAVQMNLLTEDLPKLKINFNKLALFDSFKYNELVKVSKLHLCPVNNCSGISLELSQSCSTEVSSLSHNFLPTNSEELRLERCLSTPKSRKMSEYLVEPTGLKEPIWKVLVMNLVRYSQKTSQGIRFAMSDLLCISEKVSFFGIIISKEVSEKSWATSCTLKIRDILTNDCINVFVVYSSAKKPHKDFIESIGKFDTLQVTGQRMISQSLNIYCKLTLNLDTQNLKLVSKHSLCQNALCPCRLQKSITPNFAPFTFICDIKPTKLFRAVIRVQVRVVLLNFFSFRLHCINCGAQIYQKENECCERIDLQIKIIASGVIEDSTGVADCEVHGIANIKELLGLSNEVEKEILTFAENKGEGYVKFKEMAAGVRQHMRNLGPRLKYCAVKPEIRQRSRAPEECFKNFMQESEGQKLVCLNSKCDRIDANLKVLKVF